MTKRDVGKVKPCAGPPRQAAMWVKPWTSLCDIARCPRSGKVEKGGMSFTSQPGILLALFKSRPSKSAHPRMPNAANKKIKKPTAPRYMAWGEYI